MLTQRETQKEREMLTEREREVLTQRETQRERGGEKEREGERGRGRERENTEIYALRGICLTPAQQRTPSVIICCLSQLCTIPNHEDIISLGFRRQQCLCPAHVHTLPSLLVSRGLLSHCCHFNNPTVTGVHWF